ncbi:SDR family NAD(P)-dependent oxidoreductase [Glycomyces sp. NPDC047369]
MPVIAIVGAGPGLGIEIARTFGRDGFTVALLARNADTLDTLTAELRGEGIEAAGFAADITRPDTVAAAFARIKDQYGPIDVLEFSPSDRTLAPVGVLEVTPENLQPQLDFYLSAIEVVKQVVPDMIEAGEGTILITTGGGSVSPLPFLANINIAAAALRNWALNLHNELAPHGVYAAHIAITALIGAGNPDAAPDVIASKYLELHHTRDAPELHYIALDQ